MDQIKYKILIHGSLPVDANLKYHGDIPHICTSTLIYKIKDNTIIKDSLVLCDPAWIDSQYEDQIRQNLHSLDLTFADINYVFVSHEHMDHCLALHSSSLLNSAIRLTQKNIYLIKDLSIRSAPGHTHDSLILFFKSEDIKTAVVGDAIINEEYLLNWEVYRPNGYSEKEIKQTRKTMNYLIKHFSVIIPGHGDAIYVNKELKKKVAGKRRLH